MDSIAEFIRVPPGFNSEPKRNGTHTDLYSNNPGPSYSNNDIEQNKLDEIEYIRHSKPSLDNTQFETNIISGDLSRRNRRHTRNGNSGSAGKSTEEKTNYYTFIIHKNYQNENWKALNSKKKNQGPCFATFDHGDHYHIIYSSSNATNYTRHRSRIGAFLHLNHSGITESIITTQRIKYLRQFILYCLRNGLDSIIQYGNKPNIHINDLIKKLKSEKKTNKFENIITSNICKQYIENIKENSFSRLGKIKKKNIVETIETLVEKYNITSKSEWHKYIDIETKSILLKEFGLNTDAYLQRILRNKNYTLTSLKADTSWEEIILEHYLQNIPLTIYNNEIHANVINSLIWLNNLFIENNIDIIDFFAWSTIIKNKKYKKINCLILQGPTNAGKTLIAQQFFKLACPEEIPRERDNSGFHLDQLPYASAALFEEPLITPTNIGSWKLLLEGAMVKTDIKNADKEGINRLPIYITSARDICSNVDLSEQEQVKQRVKLFTFTKTIEHREDHFNNYNLVHTIRKPPQFITSLTFCILYIYYYNDITNHILTLDKTHTPDNTCIICQNQWHQKLQENTRHLHLTLKMKGHHLKSLNKLKEHPQEEPSEPQTQGMEQTVMELE